MDDSLDSIVDILNKQSSTAMVETSDNEEILIPRKCAYCKCNVICSVLPTFIGISKIGIIIGVEECQYYIQNNTQQQKNQEE